MDRRLGYILLRIQLHIHRSHTVLCGCWEVHQKCGKFGTDCEVFTRWWTIKSFGLDEYCTERRGKVCWDEMEYGWRTEYLVLEAQDWCYWPNKVLVSRVISRERWRDRFCISSLFLRRNMGNPRWIGIAAARNKSGNDCEYKCEEVTDYSDINIRRESFAKFIAKAIWSARILFLCFYIDPSWSVDLEKITDLDDTKWAVPRFVAHISQLGVCNSLSLSVKWHIVLEIVVLALVKGGTTYLDPPRLASWVAQTAHFLLVRELKGSQSLQAISIFSNLIRLLYFLFDEGEIFT